MGCSLCAGWRRKKAAARAIGLLAAPELSVPARLDFPERHGFVKRSNVIATHDLANVGRSQLAAIVDAAAARAVDWAQIVVVGDPVGMAPLVVR